MSQKTYPTVQLKNFNFEIKITIRCTLYQIGDDDDSKKRKPHYFYIIQRRKKSDRLVRQSDFVEVETSDVSQFSARYMKSFNK